MNDQLRKQMLKLDVGCGAVLVNGAMVFLGDKVSLLDRMRFVGVTSKIFNKRPPAHGDASTEEWPNIWADIFQIASKVLEE